MKPFFSYKFLNNYSITQKMIFIFIGCVIIPLLIQNMFYFSATEQNIQEEMVQRLKLSLSEKTNKVNGCISGTVSLSLRYNTNEAIYNFLDKSYNDRVDYVASYLESIRNMLLTDVAYNAQVYQIMLFSDNPSLLSGALVKYIKPSEFYTLGEKVLDYRVDSLTNSQNGPKMRIALVPAASTDYTDRYLSIVRPLKYYPQYSKYEKFVKIDIKLGYISNMLRDSDLFDNIVLVDADNRILASANSFNETGTFDVFSEKDLKESIVVLKQPLNEAPLSLYAFYDTGIISKEFNYMRVKTILIALGSMLLSFFFIIILAGNITNRTKLVVNLSKNIAKGNFTQINEDKIGKDEIGVLAESINMMSTQLQELINNEYKSRINKAQLERETAQAKLLALQSQVNPHFMFNTLESIRLKAVVKNETETAKIIMYLSKMFRHLINWDDDVIPLDEDIRFLKEFLYIQKYRFGDEFEYEVIVDEAAESCLLPKLIIQPLVENACVHGVESISHNRKVEIYVTVLNEKLIICVLDNGIGIEEPRLKELREMLSGGKKLSHSVGLYNVYQRLSLYYGQDFSMEIHSKENYGTDIDIIIPIRYYKEEF